jgi:hypothetical protein
MISTVEESQATTTVSRLYIIFVAIRSKRAWFASNASFGTLSIGSLICVHLILSFVQSSSISDLPVLTPLFSTDTQYPKFVSKREEDSETVVLLSYSRESRSRGGGREQEELLST